MLSLLFFFFFNDTATTEIYTLSLHDALPICWPGPAPRREALSSRRARAILAALMAEDIILETRGLRKEFKGFVAVSDVSLKVRRGRIHALIGPNGAGKTT